MAHFTIEHLEPEQLADAWPLIRLAGRGETTAWPEQAARLLAGGGGVLGARAPDGSLHGVASYELVDRLPIGRSLKVDTLVSFELSRAAPARQALCEALDLLGAALGCSAVTVGMPARGFVQQRAAATS